VGGADSFRVNGPREDRANPGRIPPQAAPHAGAGRIPRVPRARPPGMSLVELLIVVVVLAILAVAAVPRFSSGREDAARAALAQDLVILNKAVELYRVQHDGVWPGTKGASTNWPTFVQQLTEATDRSGNPGGSLGPYLRSAFPVNPLNGSADGTVGTVMLLGGGHAKGWNFNPDTGEVTAYNLDDGGVTPSGQMAPSSTKGQGQKLPKS